MRSPGVVRVYNLGFKLGNWCKKVCDYIMSRGDQRVEVTVNGGDSGFQLSHKYLKFRVELKSSCPLVKILAVLFGNRYHKLVSMSSDQSLSQISAPMESLTKCGSMFCVKGGNPIAG